MPARRPLRRAIAEVRFRMATCANPTLVGVLNVSPESMVRDSIATTPDEVLERAAFLAAHGCSLLDLGGRSITPDAPMIDDVEERSRLLPALDLLAAEGYSVSVDTWSARSARASLDRGAAFVNFTGSKLDGEMLRAIAAARAGLIVTYMPYGDAYQMRSAAPVPYRVPAIVSYLESRVRSALDAGVERVVVDPNLGIIHASVDDHTKIHLQHEVLFHLDEMKLRRNYPFDEISLAPSEYFRRNMFFTFIHEPFAVHNLRYEIGVDNIMWSTDYPHPACTFPDSRKLVEAEFEGIPSAEREAIVCGNATRVWNL